MTERRKLALITTELRPGGAEKCLVELALGLSRDTWDPHVYCLAPPPPDSQSQLWKQLMAAQVPVQSLYLQRTWQLPWALRRLQQAWQRDQIELVQSFLFHANVLSAWVAPRMGIPVWGGLRVAERSALRRFVLRRWQRRWQQLVCVSHAVAAQAQAFGIGCERLIVIPNACRVDREADQEPPMALKQRLGLRADRRYLLFAGRIEWQKGLDQLLHWLPHLWPDLDDCELIILGEGPDKVRCQRTLRRRADEARIHWCGWQPHLGDWMRASELLLLPSRWEGMPNVVLEAMASRLPVVCTAVEGVADLLGPAPNPQVVPLGDAGAFVAAVRRWLLNPEAAARQGLANQQRIATTFSPHKLCTAYEQLYLAGRAID